MTIRLPFRKAESVHVKVFPFLIVASIALCCIAMAGKFNKTLSPGDASPKWKDLTGIDGKKHSLSDLKDKEIVVVVFTCNSCPYAVDCEDRLVALAKSFEKEGTCALVAICPNSPKVKGDSLEELAEKAKAKGFNFAYLQDESQKVAQAFGATRTPEFFVLGKDRKLIYQGQLDDSPEGGKVTQRYVEDAISAALAGKKPAVEETAPVGCLVRYPRMRSSGAK